MNDYEANGREQDMTRIRRYFVCMCRFATIATFIVYAIETRNFRIRLIKSRADQEFRKIC